MVHLGAISYSVYLWHWPVFVFVLATGQPLWARTAVALLVTWLVAEVSHVVVERPFLDRPPVAPARRGGTGW